jgi:hypothetical protein
VGGSGVRLYLVRQPHRDAHGGSPFRPPLALFEPDLPVPSFLGGRALKSVNLWLGFAGGNRSGPPMRSQLHVDADDNLLALLAGEKEVSDLRSPTLSHSHTLTLSHSHALTLSRSQPQVTLFDPTAAPRLALVAPAFHVGAAGELHHYTGQTSGDV